MWKPFFRDFDESYFLRLEPENLSEESPFIDEPCFEELSIRSWFAEILDLDLLEFSCSEDEVSWSDLIAKCFSTLCHTEWDLLAR